MFIVKVGEQPYIGMELGFWETREDAVKCAERYMSNSVDDVVWANKDEGIWISGSNWLHVYEIKLESDLF